MDNSEKLATYGTQDEEKQVFKSQEPINTAMIFCYLDMSVWRYFNAYDNLGYTISKMISIWPWENWIFLIYFQWNRQFYIERRHVLLNIHVYSLSIYTIHVPVTSLIHLPSPYYVISPGFVPTLAFL